MMKIPLVKQGYFPIYTNMSRFLFAIHIFLLILIHTLDMELTTHYVGNEWSHEMFLPMRLSIYYLGIHNACWLSRICTYTYIFGTLLKSDTYWVRLLLYIITWLYWAAMTTWLFSLHILNWPPKL